MKSSLIKNIAFTATLFGVIFGCNSVIDHVVNEANMGDATGGDPGTLPSGVDGSTGGGGFDSVDSDFSDAPVSPGGTGGVIGEDGVQAGEETRSFFTAFQIDPESEDTAGPKFVVAADMNQDGLLDLVSAWNQSQPIQLHLQGRDADDNISFRTINLGGTTPIALVAGLEVGQINDDGWLDIVVLAKATGFAAFCPTNPPTQVSLLDGEIVLLFSPGDPDLIADGDRWRFMNPADDPNAESSLINPLVSIIVDTQPPIRVQWSKHFPGIEEGGIDEIKVKPEFGGFASLLVADMNLDGFDDIIVALNPAECEELGQLPPLNTVDLWLNPGAGLAEESSAWGVPYGAFNRGVPLSIMADIPQVKDLAVLDVDEDGDPDLVATYTNSLSQNVRWARNPFVPHDPGGPGGTAEMVAGFGDGADLCAGGARTGEPCPNGDADCAAVADGFCADGVCAGGVRSGQSCDGNGNCLGAEAGACLDTTWRFFSTGWQERPIGQIDTAADAFAVGDLDGDGFDDIVVRSTEGQLVQWFRKPSALVVQPEFPPNDPTPDRFNFPWPVYTLTEFVNQEAAAISVGDLTGDGRNEVIAAADGAVLWFDRTPAPTVFDPWSPHTVIQDSPDEDTDLGTGGPPSAAPGTGVGVGAVDTSTYINTLLVVDLDGDGKNDIVGTLDRRSGTGLSDDRLVWYRNTRTEDEE